jgi:hypothetical protein
MMESVQEKENWQATKWGEQAQDTTGFDDCCM